MGYCPASFIGCYWGDDGFFGRHYYSVFANEGINGYLEFDVKVVGWNRYRAFYPDGVLREEGEIDVSLTGLPKVPFPDQHKVKWGNYYRPDGSLGSTVRDGTGEQMIWYPNGQLRWKLVLKNYERVSLEMWSEQGKLLSTGSHDYPPIQDNQHDRESNPATEWGK